MANRTVKDAVSIKGTNPQYLIEKIVRSRIYDSRYWKEDCFALTAELMVDKAMELKYIGGVYGGNIKPTPFLCLILKMLQIQPEKDIIIEFIRNEDFKYVRYLGAFYMRLTGTAVDVYKYLEPLYVDYRKVKRLNRLGKFEMVHMDELIDELLRNERVLDISMPRMQKRHVLEELNQLEIRISPLEENLDEIESSESEEEEKKKEEEDKKASKSKSRHERKRSESPRRVRSSPKRRSKYTDYDQPEQERLASPSSRRHRSRSGSDDRHERKKSSKHRHRSRSHSREGRKKSEKKHKRSKSRDRSRDRSEKKSRDKKR